MPIERLAELLLQCARVDAMLPRRTPANDDALHARYVDDMCNRIESLPDLRREARATPVAPRAAVPLVPGATIAADEDLEELVATALTCAQDAEDVAQEASEASRKARRGMFVAAALAAVGIAIAGASTVANRFADHGDTQQIAAMANQVQTLSDLQKRINDELTQIQAQSAQAQSAQAQSAQAQSAQAQSTQGQSAQAQSAQAQSAQAQSTLAQSRLAQSAQGQSAQGQSTQGQSAQAQAARGIATPADSSPLQRTADASRPPQATAAAPAGLPALAATPVRVLPAVPETPYAAPGAGAQYAGAWDVGMKGTAPTVAYVPNSSIPTYASAPLPLIYARTSPPPVYAPRGMYEGTRARQWAPYRQTVRRYPARVVLPRPVVFFFSAVQRDVGRLLP